MKRIEKVGELLVRAITYPLRAAIGAGRCIHKSTPDTLEDCMPFVIKKKEEKDGTSTSTEKKASS
tara:strand:- start:489 stop:683 length:195 start_codon:yes stop_codon:yes gene_type:complete